MPNKRIQFLSLQEALVIHQQLLEHFGGPEGIRDTGLLLSALYRPQTGYYKDLVEMAAALFESLLMNHPFVDGNKRAAFFITDVFLRLNGHKFDIAPEPAHQFIIGALENRKTSFDAFRQWIQSSIVAI